MIEQKSHKNRERPRSEKPLLLPNGVKLDLRYGPVRETIKIFMAKGLISRPDLMKHLQAIEPDIDVKKIKTHMGQVTRTLKPEGYAVRSEETIINGQRLTSYRFVEIGVETKENIPNPNPKKQKQPSGNLTDWKHPQIIYESLELRAQRMNREDKDVEEKRPIFIHNFSSSIVTLALANAGRNISLTNSLEEDLEDFLIGNSPFGAREQGKLIKLIGENSTKTISIETIRDFFINALRKQLIEWFDLKSRDSNIPTKYRTTVEACEKLKEKNISVEELITNVAEHFEIPTASVSTEK